MTQLFTDSHKSKAISSQENTLEAKCFGAAALYFTRVKGPHAVPVKIMGGHQSTIDYSVLREQ